MDQSLHDYVVEKLAECRGTWPDLARVTGLSKRTIEKIARREIADPGVSHIERLAAHFRQTESRVA